MTRSKDKTKGAPSPETSLTVDRAKILEEGTSAARLLNEPIFQTAFENTIQMYQDDWLATEPKESQKRESLYQKVQSLSDVAKDLAGMVQATQGVNLDDHKRDEINPTYQ